MEGRGIPVGYEILYLTVCLFWNLGRYKITENAEDTSVAVKMLKEGSSSEAKESFVQEVTLMSVLQHENILKLLAVSIEEEPFCMVFEFMSNGDLNQYLRKYDPENIDGMDKGTFYLRSHVLLTPL